MAKAHKTKFINDPDKSRLFFEVLRAIKGYTPSEISKLAEKRAKGDKRKMVSAGTIVKWFIPIKSGGTKYPQMRTCENALLAVGGSLKVVAPPEKTEEVNNTKKPKGKTIVPFVPNTLH